jgi:transposase
MFNVGDKVIDTQLGTWGEGTITAIKPEHTFPIKVKFSDEFSTTYTLEGRRWTDEDIALQLATPREFKVGSKDARNIVAMLAINYRKQRKKWTKAGYKGDLPAYDMYIKAKKMLGNKE